MKCIRASPARPSKNSASNIPANSEKLRELADELKAVGCELRDWERGLVDFRVISEGRESISAGGSARTKSITGTKSRPAIRAG